MPLKQIIVRGLKWSFIDNFSRLGITFVTGIILARLLTPKDYGLIGMISIFVAISESFISCGFGTALIRKSDCSQDDCSTVFYFNLIVSIFFYSFLFISAGAISSFFGEPQLKTVVRVLGTGLIINAFSIIQQTILTKRVDFKSLTRISLISSVFSGFIGILLAYSGFGVWSLISKMLFGYLLSSISLWILNKWRPSLLFSIKSFKEMFSFGYKLLLSGLIDSAYRNAYLLVIGKYFSAIEAGYYSRANQFNNFPSQNITQVIQRVSFPVLASIQHDTTRLKLAYKRLFKSTMLISFVLMLGLSAVAKPLMLTLLGEKWLSSAIYLQLLCFVGMLYPLHALNLEMLNILGRSDLFLRLESIKKILAIPNIFIGIFFGIKTMIAGMIVTSLIAYYLNSYYSGRFIGYSFFEQIKDITPAFFLAVIVNGLVFLFGLLINATPFILLILQIFTGTILTIGLCELLRYKDYLYVKEIFLGILVRR